MPVNNVYQDDTEPGKRRLRDLSPGRIFQLPLGSQYYMVTDRTQCDERTRYCVSLGSGCMTWIDPDKLVRPLAIGDRLHVEVQSL